MDPLRADERIDVPVSLWIEFSEGSALRSAALEGAGEAQLPAFIVGHDVREVRLVPILTGWKGRPVPLHAVYPDNRLIAARVRAFVSFLAAKAKAEVDLQPTQAQRTRITAPDCGRKSAAPIRSWTASGWFPASRNAARA